jgi:hypothetical protein
MCHECCNIYYLYHTRNSAVKKTLPPKASCFCQLYRLACGISQARNKDEAGISCNFRSDLLHAGLLIGLLEAVCSSETSVDVNQPTRRYIRCENLKSCKLQRASYCYNFSSMYRGSSRMHRCNHAVILLVLNVSLTLLQVPSVENFDLHKNCFIIQHVVSVGT